MKLKFFSEQTKPQDGSRERSSVPKIYITKRGVINFNKSSSQLMEIKPGNKITLAQDEEHPNEWYFFKDDLHGFFLKLGYNKQGCIFSHSSLVRELLESVGKPLDKNYSFLIAGQPTMMKNDKTKYWCILIS